MLAELLVEPGVREVVRLRGPVGVMALHGGLEHRTAWIARQAARRSGASLYAVIQPDDLRWHVPSISFDPRKSPGLRNFLGHVQLGISVHGFGRKGLEGTVLVGGTNRRVAREVAASLRNQTALEVIDDPDRIPRSLRGMHTANPVNLPSLGGVQVELSPQARERAAADQVAGVLAAVIGAKGGHAGIAP